MFALDEYEYRKQRFGMLSRGPVVAGTYTDGKARNDDADIDGDVANVVHGPPEPAVE